MPTYEYGCLKCGHRFDAFQKMSDLPLTTCPECGGEVHRLPTAGAGLIFKGSGFYITDYAKKNSSPSKQSPKKSDDKSISTQAPKEKKKAE